jgi:hypothetical protein
MGRLVEMAGDDRKSVAGLDITIMITHSHKEGGCSMDLFASRGPRHTERANEIKAQVASQLGLPEDAIVMVTELACLEEGCPPIETVIAVFQPAMEKLQFKVHRAIADITTQDIQEICEKHYNNQASEKDHGSCS